MCHRRFTSSNSTFSPSPPPIQHESGQKSSQKKSKKSKSKSKSKSKLISPQKGETPIGYIATDFQSFVDAMISVNVTALNVNYDEKYIVEHMKKWRLIGTDFDSHRKLPLRYDSVAQYRRMYQPLVVLDCWANVVKSFHEIPPVVTNGAIPPGKCSVTMNRQCNLFVNTFDVSRSHLTLYLKALVLTSDTGFAEYCLENWLVVVHNASGSNSLSIDEMMAPTEENIGKMCLGFVDKYKVLGNEQYSVNSAPNYLNILGRFNIHNPKPLTGIQFKIVLTNNTQNRKLLHKKVYLSIQPVAYIRQNMRYLETLGSMEEKPDFSCTFLDPDEKIYKQTYTEPKNFNFIERNSFNTLQKSAVLACFNAVQLSSSKSKVVMIQGPPGTGKTHTLVGIITNMLANCSSKRSEPLRVLVCAPSNGAVDEIARRLIRHRSFVRPLNIVRIGMNDKIHLDVKPYTLDNLVQRLLAMIPIKKNKKGYHSYQPLVAHRDLYQEVLYKADIILSTLTSSHKTCLSWFYSTVHSFRCVIVDEASQCTEPQLLMPLVYPTNKLILIGDHRQLPATVISNLSLRPGFGRSLFERLSECGMPLLTLTHQYRMHTDICSFPSRVFYSDQLQTSPNTGVNSGIPLKSYFLFDVLQAQERRIKIKPEVGKQDKIWASVSIANTDEIELIFKLLLIILNQLGHSVNWLAKHDKMKASIGVITFYRGQKQELERKLAAYHRGVLLKHVDVNTVDAFQGQERDIVILSCVRALESTTSGSVGFVRSQQRMNVALTRAKSTLFVCMHGQSFAKVPQWSQMMTDAQSRNRLVQVNSDISQKRLTKKIAHGRSV